MEFTTKFCVKVSRVGYISQTTHQEAFIFRPWVPWKVCFHAMSFGPRDLALGWGRRSKSRTPLKSVFLLFCYETTYADNWSDMAQSCDIDL